MSAETRPIPTTVHNTDAIVRLGSTTVCTTNLHVYHGLHGISEPAQIVGHEGVHYLVSVGCAVNYHDDEDHIVVPDKIGSGQNPELVPPTPLMQGCVRSTRMEKCWWLPRHARRIAELERSFWRLPAGYVRVPFTAARLYLVPEMATATRNISK